MTSVLAAACATAASAQPQVDRTATTWVSACRNSFGGPVAMPTLEKLAQNGLRYNNSHRLTGEPMSEQVGGW
jgi:hypothetical protein